MGAGAAMKALGKCYHDTVTDPEETRFPPLSGMVNPFASIIAPVRVIVPLPTAKS
jgi:hypothetical protein